MAKAEGGKTGISVLPEIESYQVYTTGAWHETKRKDPHARVHGNDLDI